MDRERTHRPVKTPGAKEFAARANFEAEIAAVAVCTGRTEGVRKAPMFPGIHALPPFVVRLLLALGSGFLIAALL
jgi:hypothetical protein